MATTRFLPALARQSQRTIALRNGQAADPDNSIAQAESSRLARQAPNKADSAPRPVTADSGSGLMAALNNFQLSLVTSGAYEYADEYQIKFAEPLIASASIVPQGTPEKDFAANVPVQNSSQQLLPEKQSLNTGSRLRSVARGQSIVQFIDQVIRSSSWIADQSGVFWDQKTSEWKLNGSPADYFVWFNIECVAEQLNYDRKRNDFAYRMTYVVTPYQVPMKSDYFYPSKIRGSHKIYNYWYTGQNSQVINYQQSFNFLWTQIIADAELPANLRQQNSPVEQWKRAYLPASGQSRQGASEKQFEPGANAADYLYSSDLAIVELSILGDPAWIPSIQPGYTNGGFTTNAFYPDGQINYQSSAPYFTVAWNKPVDYNLETGIMDTSAANDLANRREGVAGVAGQTYLYQATSTKCSFKQGRFTQEIQGQWILEQTPTTNSNAGTDTPLNQYQSDAETQRLLRQQAAAQARTVDAANAARRSYAQTDPRRLDIATNQSSANLVVPNPTPLVLTPRQPVTPTSNGTVAVPTNIVPSDPVLPAARTSTSSTATSADRERIEAQIARAQQRRADLLARRGQQPTGSVSNSNPGNQPMAREE